MDYKTDYRRVAGLGSAREGTHHFIVQRLTAIALLPLTLLFLWKFIPALGAGHGAVLAIYANPFHALVAIATAYAGFRHLSMGLQVIIEDYVSDNLLRTRMLILNSILWRGMMLVAIFAVAKIAFTA